MLLAADTTAGSGVFVDSGQGLGNENGRQVLVGDFDGDGDADAFVVNAHRPNRVLLNTNDVLADTGQSLGSHNSLSGALGDLDGDGDLDVFTANDRQGNRVWLNEGGTFTASDQVLGFGSSTGVALGDLDDDGDLDAFVTNRRSGNTVWLNDGGQFSDSGQRLGFGNSYDVELGDLDGDGDLDAFVSNVVQANRVWLNEGGIFTDSGQILGIRNSFDAALGDLDGDGDLDAYVANFFQGNSVWLNEGGVFQDSGQQLGGFNASLGTDLGDVDGDGDLDAVVANSFQPNRVWTNDGGQFSDNGQVLGFSSSNGITLADFDSDGDLDAFTSNGTQRGRLWLDPLTVPRIEISNETGAQPEGDVGETAFEFTVTRAGNLLGETAISYRVSGRGPSPANPADFGGQFPEGTITFLPGESIKTISILVSGDSLIERSERFRVTLSSEPGVANILSSVAIATIENDDFTGLTNIVSSLPEDTDTTNSIRVADVVVDEGIELKLTGSHASSFEIVGDQLHLRAGAELDFETLSALDVAVEVVQEENGDAVGPRPHLQRDGVNLLADPTVSSTRLWNNFGSQLVNATGVSRTQDGSGAWRLTTPIGHPNSSSVITRIFPIQESGVYTYSYFVRANNVPNLVGSQVKLYDSNVRFIRNEGGIPWAGVSEAGEWQEVVGSLYVDAEESPYVSLQVFKRENPLGSGVTYVDDLYFGKGEVAFDQPPTEPTAFEGGRVQVDSLGNFTINGEPFFPWMLHVNGAREDLSVYSSQGWNTNIWASVDSVVQNYEEAGMYSMIQLSHYVNTGARLYNDVATLTSRMQEIIDNGNLENIIGYYWDNEFSHNEWQVPLDVISQIRNLDPDAPVYALQGNYHVARTHASHGLVDVSGTYVGAEPDNLKNLGTDGFTILQNVEGNTRPSSISQINYADDHPGQFRLRVYNSLIAGARGVGYFGDGLLGRATVEESVWAADMPALPNEIDSVIDVIRTPHWTTWSADSPTENVRIGTRHLNGSGYLIVANQTTSTQEITLDVADLPYSPGALKSAFDGSEVATFDGNQVTFQVAPLGIQSGTMVLEISENPNPPTNLDNAIAAFTLAVSDVNEAPAVGFGNKVVTLNEQTDTTDPTWIADIVFSDDALGTNVLTLAGPDAATFEIADGSVWLRANAALSKDAQPTYQVTLEVNDEELAGAPDASAEYVLVVSGITIVDTNASGSFAQLAEQTSSDGGGESNELPEIELIAGRLNQDGQVTSPDGEEDTPRSQSPAESIDELFASLDDWLA